MPANGSSQWRALNYKVMNKKNKKEYQKKWRKKNPEKMRKSSRKYYWKNPEKIREKSRKYYWEHREHRAKALKKRRRKKRLKALIYYGGNPPKCAHCGFNKIECLDIDHIDNDGKDYKKNRSGTRLINWIIKNNHPDIFQILCKNCNWLKYIKSKTKGNNKSLLSSLKRPSKSETAGHRDNIHPSRESKDRG